MNTTCPYFTVIASLFMLVACGGGSTDNAPAEGKKLKLKGTKWQCVEKLFVADAGTETITYTLEFVTDKNVVKTRRAHMPPYPAMYMNEDGVVPTEPGWDSSSSDKGTYRIKRDLLTITYEDGSTELYDYRDGKLVSWRKNLSGEKMVFSSCE